VLLSTLADKEYTNLTMHVTARSGRVAAAVQSSDDKIGGDWLPASADPAPAAVLPGIPKDATSVRLVAFAPGSDDADLKVQLASPTGTLTPAGHENLHVKAGMTAAVDLGDVTKGEAGSLLLSPSDKAVPVVAALRVTRGKGSEKETAFIPATDAVGTRATVADNRAKGSTLSLVAPEETAKVKVTASAGTEGGSPATKTYTVKGGTTLEVGQPPVPAGLKGAYALTVEPVSGGEVYGSRMLALPEDGIPMFTIQTLPDDRGSVAVPEAERDLTVLQK
jgi:LysM repeat protein